MLARSPPHRVKGTAVFLTSDPERPLPPALLHNLKHNKVLHERNIVLTVRAMNLPRVPVEDRVSPSIMSGTRSGPSSCASATWRRPNIPRSLALLRKLGFKFDIMSTSFFLSRRSIRPALRSSMPLWQDKLFIARWRDPPRTRPTSSRSRPAVSSRSGTQVTVCERRD